MRTFLVLNLMLGRSWLEGPGLPAAQKHVCGLKNDYVIGMLEALEQTYRCARPDGPPVNTPATFVPPGGRLSAPLCGTTSAPQTTIVEPIRRAYDGTQFLGQTIQGRIPNSHFPAPSSGAQVYSKVSALAPLCRLHISAFVATTCRCLPPSTSTNCLT